MHYSRERRPGAIGASLMPSTAFTGQIKRGDTPNTVVGYLKEHPWGWTIRIFGTRDESGGYTLTGELGDPPAGLRIEAIDGPADKVC